MPPKRPLRFWLDLLVNGSLRHLQLTARNCAKRCIGRKPYPAYQGNWFPLYVKHLTGVSRIRRLTCVCSPGEGAGSQALMLMNAIAFARSCNLQYLHTPLTEVAHAERPMAEWARVWESQFSLGLGEPIAAIDDPNLINFAPNFDDLHSLFGVTDPAMLLQAHLPEFRRKYHSNKPAGPLPEFTVCVHVRRGDVTPDHPDMWTDNHVVANTIDIVRGELASRSIPHRIVLISEGEPADFACFAGIELRLNGDAVMDMQLAVRSDVLIAAKSSFSYVAGLLGTGIRIADPSHRTPLPDSIPTNPDGSLDRQAFRLQLDERLRTRTGLAAH